MEIESYQVLDQLKSALIDQGIMDLPDSPSHDLLEPFYNVFDSLKANLLSTLQHDLVNVVGVNLELIKAEFFPQDDHAQGLCYCYYRFRITDKPESFLVARLLPFYNKILLHLKEPVSIQGFPKKLNTALINNPISINELA